jgi:hypothetical protein
VLTIARTLSKRQAGGETLNGKKLTLFGVLVTASAASAFYGLYRGGLIKNEDFTKLYNVMKQSIDDKLKIISKGRATPKVRNRLSKK